VSPILRNVLSAIAGLFAGVLVIMLVETIGMAIWPPPPDLEPAELMQQIPLGALLMVELGAVLGSLTAGAVATKLGVAKPPQLAVIVGVVLMLAGISTLVMLPHPTWFVVVSTLTFVPLALLGARLVASPKPTT
jgi:hypothetical protein